MVTREEIEAAKKSNGGSGWTREQLAAWGVSWPPKKGWKSRLQYREARREPRQKMDQPCWNYVDGAERDRLEMKKLYQEKSGDYSY